jgi:hypothetical protein
LFGGNPELAPIVPPPEITPPVASVPLGRLECRVPGRPPFGYRFTADDLVTTARFLVGEAGGVDNPENRGTLWAMLNRYAFFRNKVPRWGSFGGFLRQYSQTLQPYIRRWESVKELVNRCNETFDNLECQFRPTRTETYPGTQVPMGQLVSFLELQATPWARLPESARSLALRTLTGKVPNPVGNATEVDDTKVYFRREKRRNPTRAEWEAYTRAFARRHGLAWRPEQVSYDQFGHNTLFVAAAAKSFPEGAARIVPAGAGATAPAPTPSPAPAPPPSPTAGAAYDGKTPAPGTVETRRSFPTSPPVRGDAARRSAALYDDVLNQFAVGVNPRYAHKNGATFCNIFVWDVTRAMGAEIPHWVDPQGNPTLHLHGNELSANGVCAWLHAHGARFGWGRVTLAEGIERANRGCPVVVAWNNTRPRGIGHVAMVRPGAPSPQSGPWMAQAGRKNENYIRMFVPGGVFGHTAPLEIWTHD